MPLNSLLMATAGAGGYADTVKGIDAANLIGYWPLWEASGSVADNYEGTSARDGAYTGVTLGQTGIGDGRTCPLFDGTNDYTNALTASVIAAFNGAECTVGLWYKVDAEAAWTDGQTRYLFRAVIDTSNLIEILRPGANNTIRARRKGANTTSSVDITISDTGWNHYAITISEAGDAMKAYLNGSQSGSTQTGLGAWSGGDLGTLIIGAGNTTPVNVARGYIAHVPIWTTPLSAANVLTVATV